ncbi:hypothetical protein MJO29_004786 [Puccinia striiformis f. sp. tritici]|nr:hypothetical protein MJO29_004786 [Puccinia striiformis f. sp. tritici]
MNEEKQPASTNSSRKIPNNSSMTIFPPSFNSFHNGGQSIATLIKEKRRQLSIANSPITSPTQPSSTPLPAISSNSTDKTPRSRTHTRIPPLNHLNRLELLLPTDEQREEQPSFAEVVMTPTTEEWWAFGGIRHKTSRKFSIQSTRSSITSITPTENKTTELDEEDDEEEEEEDEDEEEADDDSDHTGASSNDSDTQSPQIEPSSSITTPDSNLGPCTSSSSTNTPATARITPLNICPAPSSDLAPNSPKNIISSPLEFSAALITTEAEPTLPLPTLTSVNGIFNTPSSPLGGSLHLPTTSFPTLTAMSSFSVGSPTGTATEPLTSTALLSSLLDKTPPTSVAVRPCSLMHDGIVRKTIDPRSYSAMTGHRNLDSFIIHSSAGSGAYGIVKHAQEKGADGLPTGPPLVIKYIIKQRILADCWKRHKVLGPVPVEIHVLDHLRRVNYRPSIISMATQYMELKKSKGENLSIESIPNRSDLIQLCGKETLITSTTSTSQPHQQRTGHPNICGILDYFEDKDYYYLVMPRYGEGKDLFEHIEQSPDGLATQEVKKIFGQIVDGVAFLHDRNIVHRDLKDENVILDPNGNPQLIDFGSAAYVREGSKFVTFSGTLDFAAPEVLKGDPHGGKEIDIWALGVILFVLITGECPFWNPEEAAKGIGEGSRARTKLEEHTEKKKQISHDHNIKKIDEDENQSVLDLLKHCLNLDPTLRPSIEQICWHKFFLPNGGWSGPIIPSIAEPSLPHPPPSSHIL